MADTRPTTYALVIFNDPSRTPHSESRVRYLVTQQKGGDSPRTIAEATGEHSGHEIVEALRRAAVLPAEDPATVCDFPGCGRPPGGHWHNYGVIERLPGRPG